MLSVLAGFTQLCGLAAAEKPAEKDWPLLLNLGRNFLFINAKSPQTCLGEEPTGEVRAREV